MICILHSETLSVIPSLFPNERDEWTMRARTWSMDEKYIHIGRLLTFRSNGFIGNNSTKAPHWRQTNFDIELRPHIIGYLSSLFFLRFLLIRCIYWKERRRKIALNKLRHSHNSGVIIRSQVFSLFHKSPI